MDLAGPLPASNPHGHRYGSIFVDDHTLYYGAYPIKSKSDHEIIHKRYCADMASHGGMSIQEFHSDNGGEFIGERYSSAILEDGAKKTTTVPYTPNQNPLAEGAFWKIFSTVRSVLIHAGLSKNLWAHAYVFAAYVLNRVPRILRDKRVCSSYELLNNRKPSLHHIKVFGCLVHVLIEKPFRDTKLGDVAYSGIHLGVSRYQRGWIVWQPGSNKFTVARNVRFEEAVLYRMTGSIPPSISLNPGNDALEGEDEEVTPTHPGEVADTRESEEAPHRPALRNQCRTPGCTLRLWHLGNHETVSGADEGADVPPVAPVPPAAGVVAPSAPARYELLPTANKHPGVNEHTPAMNECTGVGKHATTREDPTSSPQQLAMPDRYALLPGPGTVDAHAITLADLYDDVEITKPGLYQGEPQGLVSLKSSKLMKGEDGSFKTIRIPRNYNEVKRSKDYAKWLKAMKEEFDSHTKAGTWELVCAHELKGRKIVGSTWSYDVKRKADGTVERYKARFCAQGFSQLEGWDYHHTYSNTVRPDTLRALFGVCAAKGYKLSGGDVKTAYLNGTLKETIFMRQAQGFEVLGEKGEPMVCRLRKSIYGLKQSGACWEERLQQELASLGLEQSVHDPCLYKLSEGTDVLFLAVYVDDLVFASSSPSIRDQVMEKLTKAFEVKDTGDLTWFLGTAIKQDIQRGSVSMDQSLYIEDMYHSFLPEEPPIVKKPRTLPCTEQIFALPLDLPLEQHDPRYRSGVGKLNWLVTMTRFDLAFVHSLLGRFNNCGGAPHMEVLLNAIRYAFSTRHYALSFGPDRAPALFKNIADHSKVDPSILSERTMIAFTDASHGGEKPMAGFLCWFFGGLLGYSAYRLPHTSLSSCEAEYVAATRTVMNVLSLRSILAFLGIQDKAPTVIFCDNSAAIMLSENNTSSKRLKHVATRLAFLREAVKEEKCQLHHVQTQGMVADIFTKPLPATQFHYLRRLILI
jgi:hypothetical protein